MLALIGARTVQLWRSLILGSLLLTVCLGALAQPAGEVEFARGVGFAQTQGQLPRILGKGLRLMEGDRLTIADDSAAIIKLQDGTRMTLRPNSEMIVQQYQFKEGAEDNSMVLQTPVDRIVEHSAMQHVSVSGGRFRERKTTAMKQLGDEISCTDISHFLTGPCR